VWVCRHDSPPAHCSVCGRRAIAVLHSSTSRAEPPLPCRVQRCTTCMPRPADQRGCGRSRMRTLVEPSSQTPWRVCAACRSAPGQSQMGTRPNGASTCFDAGGTGLPPRRGSKLGHLSSEERSPVCVWIQNDARMLLGRIYDHWGHASERIHAPAQRSERSVLSRPTESDTKGSSGRRSA